MLGLVLVRAGRFYRVEVSANLFGEYSVWREWGCARQARQLSRCFATLREACAAADRWSRRMQHRGYTIKEWMR